MTKHAPDQPPKRKLVEENIPDEIERLHKRLDRIEKTEKAVMASLKKIGAS